MSPGCYHLGLPLWGMKEWVGNLYARGARPGDFLRQYATVFDTVEGNTTFYSVPAESTVLRWRDATPDTFRFCFKLPQTVTHAMGLVAAEGETDAFLRRMEPLGERLGPFMIQLPSAFGPPRLDVLDAFLASLPRAFDYAVEVRHRAFFEDDGAAARVDELLAGHGCDRVIMDTRALRAGDRRDPAVREASRRKPNLPIHRAVTASRPIVRFIGHPDDTVDTPFLDEWATTLAGWLADGHTPYLFIHCPDNSHAPPLARRAHETLAALAPDVGAMPDWPGEAPEPKQLRLL